MTLAKQIKGFTVDVVDRLMPVKPMSHSPEQQSLLDKDSRQIHLYYCRSCASSIQMKRLCERLGLRVVEKDVEKINAYRNELVKGGGQPLVPCLHLNVPGDERWIYGPDQITNFLQKRYPVQIESA